MAARRPQRFKKHRPKLPRSSRKPRIRHSLQSLPNEIWDNIKENLSPFFTGLLSRELDIPTPKGKRYENIWYAIFKDERWLNYVVKGKAHPGLLGSNLDGNQNAKNQYVVLLLHNDDNISPQWSQTRFFESLRPYTEVNDCRDEIIVGGICLNIRELFGRAIRIGNADNLFLKGRSNYCFWTDPRRRLRTIEPPDIVSQNDEVFCLKLRFLAPDYVRHLEDCIGFEEHERDEKERMYQVFVHLQSITNFYFIRIGNVLPALKECLYSREVIRFERARWFDPEEYAPYDLHPNDHVLANRE